MIETTVTNLPIFWLVIAVVLAILEMLVPAFGFIFGTLAALVTAVVALSPLGWTIQLVIFAAVLVFGLLLLRPRLAAKLKESQGVPSRTESLLGKVGILTEATDPDLRTGRVLVEGQDWAAQASQVIQVNRKVVVEGSDGIVLIVREV